MTTDDTPLGEALSRYYADHGLPPDGGASKATFTVKMGPVSFPLPNPPARKRAVFFHDANHVIAGYNTVFSEGEVEIAGFEIGSGCGPYWIAWVINIGVIAVGLFVNPDPMFRAFVRGRRTGSIYERTEDRAMLSGMTVGAVRAMVGIDRNTGPVTARDRISFAIWSTVALVWALLPVAAIAAIVSALT